MQSQLFTALQHAHSLLRWLMLVVLIYVVAASIIGWVEKRPYTKGHQKLVFYTVLIAHVQLIIGFVLYFLGPWAKMLTNLGDVMGDAIMRFFTVEHMIGMLIAIVLLTIGSARSKKVESDQSRYKLISLFFGIGLLLILLSIAWPFREAGEFRGWF